MGEHGDTLSPGDQQYPPITIDPKGKDAAAIAQEFVAGRTIDISSGFPAQDAEQVWQIFQQLLFAGVSRIPIVATADGVFASFDPQLNQHLTLWERLGEPDSVKFTTSLESFSSDFSDVENRFYIELKDVDRGFRGIGPIYVPVGIGTDMIAFKPELALSKEFTEQGMVEIKRIFSLPGVVCHFEGTKPSDF